MQKQNNAVTPLQNSPHWYLQVTDFVMQTDYNQGNISRVQEYRANEYPTC